MNVYSQTQTNALFSSQVPVPRRPADILGGANRVIDETGEKVKEDFLHFLNHFREDSGHTNVPTSQGDFAIPHNLTSMTSFPTSEMLTPSDLDAPSTSATSPPYYVTQLHDMRRDGHNTVFVDFSHVYHYNDVLASAIADSYYRFEPFLLDAIKGFVRLHAPSYLRLPNSNQERDFWLSFYGINLVHK
jgi:DNA replicative helicase MCM subunit Mcm2 (Cdc46/Mcm family)